MPVFGCLYVRTDRGAHHYIAVDKYVGEYDPVLPLLIAVAVEGLGRTRGFRPYMDG
jgi:hypothetical protein